MAQLSSTEIDILIGKCVQQHKNTLIHLIHTLQIQEKD